MDILGFSITRTKALPVGLAPAENRQGWFTIARIRESFAGAWQSNVEVSADSVLTHPTVFACVTLIAFDVAKLRVRLVEQQAGDIWNETESSAFSPVLKKPNRYQNRIQFFETWMLSKLIAGNTYVLKQRDQRGVVASLYVLNPNLVTPMVAENGDVYYQLRPDNLAGVPRTDDNKPVYAPASEIVHDVYVALYHPLVGVSPMHAAGIPATQALHIQENSTQFFANGATPGGMITAPGTIPPDVAARLKSDWETNFGGENIGRVAVLGAGMTYEPIKMMSATDAQVVEQLKWSDEKICSAYHVPGYKVGVGTPPPYNTVVQRNQEYYSDCIQIHLESIELLLDEGLGLAPSKIEGRTLGTEFDLEGLMRMDPAAQIDAAANGVKGSLTTINEARRRLNLPPKKGGDTIYSQQQNFSIEALADRDKDQPFAKPAPPPVAELPPGEQDDPGDEDDEKAFALMSSALLRRSGEIARRVERAAA